MGNTTKIVYSDFFTSGHFETLPETLAFDRKNQSFTIGIPKESNVNENRVPIVPSSVMSLIGSGFTVKVESRAGEDSNYTDLQYSEAGAYICHNKEDVYKCNIIIKISPPSIDEIELMDFDQILISPLLLPLLDAHYLEKLMSKRITSLAMEYLQSQDGSFPIVRIQSEIAGRSVMLTAGELLKNQNGQRGIFSQEN